MPTGASPRQHRGRRGRGARPGRQIAWWSRLAEFLAVATLLAGCLPGSGGQARPATPEVAVDPTRPPMTLDGPPIRYVALGDSYTIGTSVAEAERWPNQLVARVAGLELVANLGVNGFTSRDLIEVELPRLDGLRPEVLSVLIGVNDVVQGVPAEQYRRNVVSILDAAVDRVGAENVVVVTTPDYTVTPHGSDYGDPAQQAAGIREHNAIITEVARALGIVVVDIHDISLEAANDRSLVAADGLHPSGAQYARWVERIVPAMEAILGR
jgi:lysophospholipase L1-like esterase